MKIKSNYKLREIAGENVVINQGITEANLTSIISLNSSAKLLWEELTNQEFDLEQAAQVLVKTYAIDHEQALKDADNWIQALKKCNIITE